MEKKIIHLFLSSCDEDTHDLRMELGNYVRALNDRFENLYFRLWMNGRNEDSDARIGESDYVFSSSSGGRRRTERSGTSAPRTTVSKRPARRRS